MCISRHFLPPPLPQAGEVRGEHVSDLGICFRRAKRLSHQRAQAIKGNRMAPDVSSTSAAEPAPAKPAPGAPERRARGFLGWLRVLARFGLLGVIVVCLVAIVYVRTRATGDSATVNIQTLILSFFAMVALLVRMLLRSDISLLARLIRISAIVIPICVLVSVLRIDHVSGSLVPSFNWRWAPRPDEMLDAPRIADNAGKADLLSTTRHDFPQFLGPGRDLHLPDIQLVHDWTAAPPQQIWRHPIGAGWSGFAVVNGYAVTMEQRGPDELITCYAVESGKPIWSHAVAARHETLPGGIGPRCTPTIDEGRVYALGATGILRCLDGATGKLLWSDDILKRAGVTVEQDLKSISWGRSASPLVVDDLVVVPLGGPANGTCRSLVAYDKTTGEVRWLGGDDQASYSSPALATLCGIRQIIIVNEKTVSGHRLEDGTVIWSYPWQGESFGRAERLAAGRVAARSRAIVQRLWHRR